VPGLGKTAKHEYELTKAHSAVPATEHVRRTSARGKLRDSTLRKRSVRVLVYEISDYKNTIEAIMIFNTSGSQPVSFSRSRSDAASTRMGLDLVSDSDHAHVL